MILWVAAALASVPDGEVELRVGARGTGDPIAGAVVTVGGSAPAITGEDGRVRVPLGAATAHVEADGWTPADVALERDRDGVLRIALEPARGDLEVVVEAFRPAPDAVRQVVDAEQALETPGGLDDAVRLVQALPGVAVQREYSPSAGDLAIRGAGGPENRYFLDGIEVPYLYHYNQYASVFPATQLSTLELFPSTFGSEYGDAVGGVVEATSALARPEAVHGSASLNFVMAGADVEAPVGRRGWVSVAGRRSYLDFAGDATAQYPVWPRFWDGSVRAGVGGQDAGSSAFMWGAGDAWTRAAGELDALDPVEADATPRLDFRHGFVVAGADHRWDGEVARGRAVLAVVHGGTSAALTSGGLEDLDDLALAARVDDHWTTGEHTALDLGFELRPSRTALTVEPDPSALLVAEEAPALARGVPTDATLLRARGGAYGTLLARVGSVRIMPGARFDVDSAGGGSVRADPRLAAQWRLREPTMLRVAGGRYSERPESESLIPGTGDPDLPTTGSWQVAGGLEQTVAGRLAVDLDGYHKWTTDPLVYPIDAAPYAVPSGRSYGVELTARYRVREVFFVWGWAALGRSLLRTDAGDWIPSDADQLVSGGAVASLDVRRWSFGARWRYASGLPYTPLTDSVYDGGDDSWIPVAGEENAARMPAYTKLDARIAHRWDLPSWSLELSFEIWYVPAANAQLYPVWSYDYSEQTFVVGPSVLPLAGARARF